MPGRSTTKKRKAILEEMGEERIAEEIMQLGTVTKFVTQYFEPHPDFPDAKPSPNALYEWIKEGGDERRKWWDGVRKVRAHQRAEMSTDRLDSATTDDYRLKTEQAKQDRWLASVLNREDYGEKATVQNTIQIGDQWLEALKAHTEPTPEEIAEPVTLYLEGEVVDDDDA